MLFRTVYGQELEAIYRYVEIWPDGTSRQQIIAAFIPHLATTISPQNVEDALSFLASSYLIVEADGLFKTVSIDQPFKLALLRNLRRLEIGMLDAKHPLDSVYMALLRDCFIQPDTLYASNLHSQANSMNGVKKLGGISIEKIQAWKRVMEYLGLGHRAHAGFIGVIAPELMMTIISRMTIDTLTLQSFFEQILVDFLPYLNRSGDVAQTVRQPMLYLAQHGVIQLTTLQDSPAKAYFQPDNLRLLTRVSGYARA